MLKRLSQSAGSVRRWGTVLAIGLGCMVSGHAQTDTFPNQRINIVVGFPPGGGVDIVARLIAEKLSPLLKQPVVVENRPGASSGIAARHVAQAKPDGYTLFLTSNSVVANQLINKDAGYDVEQDLASVGKYVAQANIFVAHPSTTGNSVASVIAQSKGADVTFASPGIGSIPHLAAEQLFNVIGGGKIRHIPYPGAAPALTATAGNQVPYAMVTAPPAVNLIKSGRLKGIAVASAKRMPALPDVPTMIESGYPGFVVDTWAAVFAPRSTPAKVIDTLHHAIASTLSEPDVRSKLMDLGFEVDIIAGPAFQHELSAEVKSWKSLLTKIELK